MLLGETTTTTYHLIDGILFSRIKPNTHMTHENAKENEAMRNTFEFPEHLPGLMDLRNLERISFKGLMATVDAAKRTPLSAAAILFNKTAQQIIAKEATIFHRASYPLKAFNDEEKALQWLRSYL